MGGMAAQIPIKDDPAANEAALAKVRADKLREVTRRPRRHLGRAPGPRARSRATIFDAHMPGPNQLANKREDVHVTEEDLLAVPEGTRTEAGLRHNIRVGVQYLEAWLRGQGCVPLYNLMEDAATAEISRAQVWQWMHHGAPLDGRPARHRRSASARVLAEEMERVEREGGRERYAPGASPRPARSSSGCPPRRASRSSSPCPPTSRSSTARLSALTARFTLHRMRGAHHVRRHDRTLDASPHAKLHAQRFDGITRPYSAADVEKLRGSIQIEHTLAELGARRLWELLHTEDYVTRSARSPATRPCRRCAPASRRSTSRAGRSRPTRTPPGRCTRTRASTRSTACPTW